MFWQVNSGMHQINLSLHPAEIKYKTPKEDQGKEKQTKNALVSSPLQPQNYFAAWFVQAEFPIEFIQQLSCKVFFLTYIIRTILVDFVAN